MRYGLSCLSVEPRCELSSLSLPFGNGHESVLADAWRGSNEDGACVP